MNRLSRVVFSMLSLVVLALILAPQNSLAREYAQSGRKTVSPDAFPKLATYDQLMEVSEAKRIKYLQRVQDMMIELDRLRLVDNDPVKRKKAQAMWERMFKEYGALVEILGQVDG